MKWLALKIPPPVLFAIFAGAMYGLSRLQQFDLPHENRLLVGLVLFGIGMAISMTGVWQFARAKTTIDPRHPGKASALVTSGVYKITRNPMYLGQVVIISGWAFYLASLYGVILLPVFAVYLDRFQIVPEERILNEKFGNSFTDYRKRVRRWL